MGCQTGFYALTLGLEPEEFFPILEATLNDILNATEVPGSERGAVRLGRQPHPRRVRRLRLASSSRHAMSGRR